MLDKVLRDLAGLVWPVLAMRVQRLSRITNGDDDLAADSECCTWRRDERRRDERVERDSAQAGETASRR